MKKVTKYYLSNKDKPLDNYLFDSETDLETYRYLILESLRGRKDKNNRRLYKKAKIRKHFINIDPYFDIQEAFKEDIHKIVKNEPTYKTIIKWNNYIGTLKQYSRYKWVRKTNKSGL